MTEKTKELILDLLRHELNADPEDRALSAPQTSILTGTRPELAIESDEMSDDEADADEAAYDELLWRAIEEIGGQTCEQ